MSTLPRYILLALIFLSGCTTTSTPTATRVLKASPEHSQLTIEPGVLTVAIDQAWPPFQYRDDSGQAAGFDVDLAGEIATRMGLGIKVIPGSWAAAQAMVREETADCIFSLTPSEERAMVFDFSAVYLKTSAAVIVKTDSPARKIEDLYDLKVAAESGSLGWIRSTLGSHYERIRIVKTESIGESLKELQENQVDAAVVGAKEVASYTARQLGLEYRAVFEAAGSTSTIGVKKNKTALLDEINRTLAETKADGTYSRLYERWFGKS